METIKKETPLREEVPNPSIANKLLEFQKRVSAISKDSVNPFFKSKYFDVNTVIDTIKPILNEVGLVVLQPIGIQDGKNILITEIWDGSDLVNNSLVLIPEITDIQKFGAALTYLRRYALVSLLLLQGEEDDDGNSTTKAPVKPNSAPSTTKPLGDDKHTGYFCSVHDNTIILRPAGITKQGKKYPAFYACSEKDNGNFCKAPILDTNGEVTNPNAHKKLEEVPTITYDESFEEGDLPK